MDEKCWPHTWKEAERGSFRCEECGVKIAPVPNCYGCMGTGYIRWAGMKPNQCPCLDSAPYGNR